MGAILNNDVPNPDSFTRRAHEQVGDLADRQGCAASLSLKGRTITHAPSAKLHLTLGAADSGYVQPATGILGLPALGAQSPQTSRFISSCVWLKTSPQQHTQKDRPGLQAAGLSQVPFSPTWPYSGEASSLCAAPCPPAPVPKTTASRGS